MLLFCNNVAKNRICMYIMNKKYDRIYKIGDNLCHKDYFN